MEKLTLFAGDSLVKTYPLLADVLEQSLGQEVDYSTTLYDFRKKLGQKLSSWKMSQDFYQVTRDAILEQSSLHWPKQGIATLNGEFWIRNSSEYPNAVVESSLLEVLQTEVNSRYSLSAKAAAGIIRRASKREKQLPLILQEALAKVVLAGTQKE